MKTLCLIAESCAVEGIDRLLSGFFCSLPEFPYRRVEVLQGVYSFERGTVWAGVFTGGTYGELATRLTVAIRLRGDRIEWSFRYEMNTAVVKHEQWQRIVQLLARELDEFAAHFQRATGRSLERWQSPGAAEQA